MGVTYSYTGATHITKVFVKEHVYFCYVKYYSDLLYTNHVHIDYAFITVSNHNFSFKVHTHIFGQYNTVPLYKLKGSNVSCRIARTYMWLLYPTLY